MKKFVWMITLLFSLFFALDKVSAETTCTYGLGTGKNWNKQLTLILIDGEKSSILFDQSPLFSKYKIHSNDTSTIVDIDEHNIMINGNPGVHIGYKIYNNEETYKKAEEVAKANKTSVCPPTLTLTIRNKIEYSGVLQNMIQTFLNVNPIAWVTSLFTARQSDAYYIYSDGLSEPEMEKLGFNIGFMNSSNVSGEDKTLILESAKDIANIETSCTTYNTYLQSIQLNLQGKKCEGNSEFTKEYQELSELCDAFRSTHSYITTDDSMAKKCSSACSRLKDDIASACKVAIETNACNSLGNKIIKWIFRIINIVRYAVPALLIILSILDYLKALASDSEDEMKKVTGRFAKRLIAAALIFLIPFVLDFILRMFNIPGFNAENPFCAN